MSDKHTFDVPRGYHFDAWFDGGPMTTVEFAAHITAHSPTWTAEAKDDCTVAPKLRELGSLSLITSDFQCET